MISIILQLLNAVNFQVHRNESSGGAFARADIFVHGNVGRADCRALAAQLVAAVDALLASKRDVIGDGSDALVGRRVTLNVNEHVSVQETTLPG